MQPWPDRRILDLFGIETPIVQAPMAGPGTPELAIAVSEAGGLARGIINRLMREVGPISPLAPAFPLAGGAVAPLRAAAEPKGSGDFQTLWSGQAARLAEAMPAADLTRKLAAEALARLTPR